MIHVYITAARFGVPLQVSEEEKKAARAAKFGLPVTAAKPQGNNSKNDNKNNNKNGQKGEKRKPEPIAKREPTAVCYPLFFHTLFIADSIFN
jgi:hypothetical protein